MKKKIFLSKVLYRGFSGSLITNLMSENGNSEIQDGGANMADKYLISNFMKRIPERVYTREFSGSRITNLISGNGNSEFQDGGQIFNIKTFKTHL